MSKDISQAAKNRFDLRGKSVIITGGGKGIGKIYAREFAHAGARVVAALSADVPEATPRAPHVPVRQILEERLDGASGAGRVVGLETFARRRYRARQPREDPAVEERPRGGRGCREFFDIDRLGGAASAC